MINRFLCWFIGHRFSTLRGDLHVYCPRCAAPLEGLYYKAKNGVAIPPEIIADKDGKLRLK